MNPTNCPYGRASDQVMLYGPYFVPDSCSVNLTVYGFFFGSLVIVRVMITLVQFRLWYLRRMQQQEKGAHSRKKKMIRLSFPLFPVLSTISSLSLFLFTLLTALDIAHAGNNGAASLFCIYFIPFIISTMLGMRRLIQLGAKIIPLSKATLRQQHGDEDRDKVFAKLTEADVFLKLSLIVPVAILIVIPLSVLIFGFIFPASFAPLQVCFACIVLGQLCFGAGASYQIHRVLQAVNRSVDFSKNPEQIIGALRKLHAQQIIAVVFGVFCGPCTTLLITIPVVKPYWW